jgi:hypothetical protein
MTVNLIYEKWFIQPYTTISLFFSCEGVRLNYSELALLQSIELPC